MAVVLLWLVMMASPATMTTVTPNATNTATTNQPSSGELIKAAQTRHNRIFGAYVLILVLTVLGTYLVWNSGNKVQEAIQADASARIEEAKQGVEQLTNDNLTLSSQLTVLQDATAKQQERAANAERSLLELRQRMADRTVSPKQREKMLAVLRKHQPGRIVMQSLTSGGREALQYSEEIGSIFRTASWTVIDPNGRGGFDRPITGVFLVVSPDMESSDLLEIVIETLIAGDIAKSPLTVSPDTRIGTGLVEIWVASK
jgi:hypothetical protein